MLLHFFSFDDFHLQLTAFNFLRIYTCTHLIRFNDTDIAGIAGCTVFLPQMLITFLVVIMRNIQATEL